MELGGELTDSISINLREPVVRSTGWALPLLIQPLASGLGFTSSQKRRGD